ncbi:MAG: TetR/AcrR family transcriptional regulator [Novosphingobium sp.]|nr:TetR/AcrR family transcriptional regulator [Novosphingobium sp.]MCP5404038.1 TetR/AcrR family transcriptional regulator [Novosphingobium sp.]
MARPSRRKASQAAQENQNSREAILDAALQSFARDGYDGASLPRIAKLAKVAPPLIHYYFGSKEKLWRETVDYSLGELKREAEAISQATRALAPLDRLRALLQAHTLFAAKWPDHFFMIIAEARSDSGRFDWLQENYTGVLFNDVVAILRDARDAGAIRDVPLDQLAIVLIGGILLYFTVYPSRPPKEEIDKVTVQFCDMMYSLLLDGVRTQDKAKP